MIDEVLLALFAEAVGEKLGRSRRAQLLWRMFFGLVGTFLGAVGAIHFAQRGDIGGNAPMRWSMVAMFVALASLSLFNVALGRKWRWPALCFALSFVLLFASRLLLGR